jgi:hypothetical protein
VVGIDKDATAGYKARPYPRCDPFDAERAAFLDGAR